MKSSFIIFILLFFISLKIFSAPNSSTHSNSTDALTDPLGTYVLTRPNVSGTIATVQAVPFINGSIPYADTSTLVENNANLFWDMLNLRLGIGTNVPTSTLHVVGASTLNGAITTNLTAGAVISNGSGVLSNVAPSTAGYVLTSNGSTWVSSPNAGGGISSPSDVYYVDGNLGNDSTTTGDQAHPCLTIQRCINLSGQPVSLQDALRHIEIHVSGKQALPAALFSGIYTENLTVPNRFMTIFGFGIKLDGNILKEYSSSRRFGASSSEFRPTLTLVGLNETRDSHPRIRNGFHVGGTNRTSILTRNTDSVQGNGTNKVTIHVTAGQFDYPITISTPAIRIKVNNTTNYNFTYDITADLGGNTFEATRVSGTNVNTGVETGNFFESDSAGASGMTHDSHFINTYQQGAYTCDDGTVNGAAYTAGTEVLYSVGSRWFTGIEGRGILMQRWENTTLAGASIVNSMSGMNNNTFAGTITTNTFTYATDDQGFTNNRFNSAVPITVSSAGQTVRMDGVSYSSFLASGSSWITNTPTIALLNSGNGIGNVAAGNIAATNVQSAINELDTEKEPVITILPVSKGGTGANTLALNNVVLGNTTSAVQLVAPSTSGNVLTSNGTTWISSPLPSGIAEVYNNSDLTLTNLDTIAVSTTAKLQRWLVQGGAGAIDMSTTPFSGGVPDGTEITVIGNDSSNTVRFETNDIPQGCILKNTVFLHKYDVITFVYNLALDRFVEKSRNF
jgi:hypothetical protein